MTLTLLVFGRFFRPRPFSRPGVMLAKQEREQQQQLLQLLVAQGQLDGQLKHGSRLVSAGRPANCY